MIQIMRWDEIQARKKYVISSTHNTELKRLTRTGGRLWVCRGREGRLLAVVFARWV